MKTPKTPWPSINCLVLLLALMVANPGPGSASVLPSGAVVISPGEEIQSAVDSSPPGTTFFLLAGVHRLQTVVPRGGDTFTGDQGAIMSGATLLTSFHQEGRYWVASGQTQVGKIHGVCQAGYPRCNYPQDVFIDDVPLQQVPNLAEVVANKWYFDFGAGKIYFIEDPQGHTVELSVTQHAFYGSARDVTIRGLIIEKYATPAQSGAIHAMTDPGPLSHNWVVENNEIRLNHGGGIRSGHGTHILNNKIHHNGQIGIGGAGTGILVAGNEIDHNNYAGFSYGWEAGGAKFSATNDLVVRKNFVHDNEGPGLWTDGDNVNALYEGNRITHNKVAGIFHEISFDAIIRNNVVKNDGFSPSGTSPWHGAGILLNGSSGVEIYGNTVINCMNGIVAVQAERGSSKTTGKPYLVKDNYVHDNTVTQANGSAAAIARDGTYFDDSIFTSWNNRFQNNTYRLADPNGQFYAWEGGTVTRTEWQNYGNDINGKWY